MKYRQRVEGNIPRKYRVEIYTMSERDSETENHFSEYFEHGNGD